MLHALVINLALGLGFSALFLVFGPADLRARWAARAPRSRRRSPIPNVVFAGNVLVWLMNALGSVIRGTGNMLVPSLAICVGVVLLVPLSPLLIFGWGPIPALGIAGGGWAVLIDHGADDGGAGLVLCSPAAASCASRSAPLRWPLFADILRVGAVGSISTLQTTLTVALTTALVGAAGGPGAVAGYGTGARLEYLLIPLVFGLGAPLVALVGTNIGAGQRAARAAHRPDRRRPRLRR